MKDVTRPAIFKWRQTAPEVILCVVRWYLRYSLSLSVRDVEELLTERGLEADHTTIWSWVQRYDPELEQRMRRHLKPSNKSWRVDETYVRVKGSLVLPVSGHRFLRSHNRFSAFGVARRRGRQTAVSQGTERSIASATPRHQHRSGADLRLSHPGHKEGRGTSPPLPAPTGTVPEQHLGTRPPSD